MEDLASWVIMLNDIAVGGMISAALAPFILWYFVRPREEAGLLGYIIRVAVVMFPSVVIVTSIRYMAGVAYLILAAYLGEAGGRCQR